MLEHLEKPSDTTTNTAMETQFIRHLSQVKAWLRAQPHIEMQSIRYAEVLADPRAVAERIQRFLGRALQVEAMVAEVEPQLYRNRAARD